MDLECWTTVYSIANLTDAQMDLLCLTILNTVAGVTTALTDKYQLYIRTNG